ncbi:MAG: hypothetical protein ABL896_13305 [Hylemonella sp.]
MTHQIKTHKNLDDFHDWPAKYRHWSLEVAEDHQHHIWISTQDLREIYPYLPPDKVLVQMYRSAMFYVKSHRRFYISERSMTLALHKSRTGHTEALKFLDWFGRNIGAVAAKKAANTHHERVNEIRAEHSEVVKIGPLPGSSGALHLDASTIPHDAREKWARKHNEGESEKVFRIEALPMRTTWEQFAQEKLAQIRGFLKAVWRGEKSLFVTLALGIFVGFIPVWVNNLMIPLDLDVTRDYWRLYWGQIFYLVLSVPAGIWFTVTLCRSTWRSFGLPWGKLWATPVFVMFITLAPEFTFGRFDLDLFEQWYDMLRGKYEPATVWVDKSLGRIVVTGSLKLGSTQALENMLAANPKMTLLQIESSGGRVVEGMRMAQIVMKRNMDTVSMDYCFSACTFILQAGADRYLGPEVKVGFHRSGTRYGPISSGWSHVDHYVASYYRKRGASEAFINKALTPSIKGLWVPAHEEMLEAGYANVLWRDRRPGY